jgi:peptidoglycan/xylan/chitin deacetylase (PgdA/CDA1 family)
MYRKMRFPDFKGKALTLSYDDGVEQDIRLIGIMQKNGLKGTFNINSGLFAPEGTVYPEGQIHRRMTKDAAYKLYLESGMEVAVHAYYHPHLETLTDAEVTFEILQDRIDIEKNTGKIIRGMAYPYGSTSQAVVDVLKRCGILYARTVASTNNFSIAEDWLRLPATCHHNSPELMKLAKRFAEASVINEPMLFYLWGHSYEFETNNNWNVIEEFAEYIGNRDDIWYATNIEIFEYIEAYKQLKTSADGTKIYNPTAKTLYFSLCGNNYKLAPAETLEIPFAHKWC